MPEPKRYVLVREGFIENVVLWDGEADWEPPEGYDLTLESKALKDGLTWRPADVFEPES